MRPEDINLSLEPLRGPNVSQVTVSEMEFLGSFYRLILNINRAGEQHLVAEVSNNRMRELEIEIGSQLYIQLPPDLIRVYPGKVGRSS